MTAVIIPFRGNLKPKEPRHIPAQVFILKTPRPPDLFELCMTGALLFAAPMMIAGSLLLVDRDGA